LQAEILHTFKGNSQVAAGAKQHLLLSLHMCN
jgi:hypothetical protein